MSTRSTSTATASFSAEAPGPAARRPAGGRLLALVGVTLGWFALWLAGSVAVLPLGRARRGVRRWAFRGWASQVSRVLALRVVVDGPAPEPPFFLVSNHLSYLDVVVYAATGPARFVAKREVRGWPGVGFLARTMGTIFIDRTVKRDAVRALDQLARAVRDGDGVILFAEATSTAGTTVLPFRPALLEWAARTGYPVHYASLSYRTPEGAAPAQLAVCWWGDMEFGRHLVELCRLPRIEASLRFGGSPIEDDDRKRLAARLHRAVAAQFTPVALE